MIFPTIEQAHRILDDGYNLNPGKWYSHCKYTAVAAKLIASKIIGVNEEEAYILGLLHDIGRKAGNYNMRHTIDGYNYLMDNGYELPARICITHLFPSKDINAIIGKWDCSKDEMEFIKIFIENSEYNIFDELIQLCDFISQYNGFTILEKRFVDVALRYGIDQFTLKRWEALFSIKAKFDDLTKVNIYSILPEIAETTLYK